MIPARSVIIMLTVTGRSHKGHEDRENYMRIHQKGRKRKLAEFKFIHGCSNRFLDKILIVVAVLPVITMVTSTIITTRSVLANVINTVITMRG